MHHQNQPLSSTRILRRSDVEAITGLSRATLYRRLAAGTFPKQFALGGSAVGWLEAEVTTWIEERAATRH
jgi:prophage regulatory protein